MFLTVSNGFAGGVCGTCRINISCSKVNVIKTISVCLTQFYKVITRSVVYVALSSQYICLAFLNNALLLSRSEAMKVLFECIEVGTHLPMF